MQPVRVGTSAFHAGQAGKPRLPGPDESYLDPAWFNQPRTIDRAVQAALLNNPRVRAELARLDTIQAERVQAGLLRNPMGSLMVLQPEGGGRYELDYSLMQSLFDLFTRSRRIAVADAAQRQVEAEVIGQLAMLAQDTGAAYYEALAQGVKLRTQREQSLLADETLRLLQHQATQGVISATVELQQQAAASMQAHEVQVAEAILVQARSALAQAIKGWREHLQLVKNLKA